MRWLKLFTLSSVLFISAVIFGSQPTYAISQTFTYDSTNMPYNRDFTAQDVGFSFKYVTFNVVKTGTTGRRSDVFCFYWTAGATQCNSIYLTNGVSFLSMYVPDSIVYIGNNASSFTSLTITFSDTLPTEQEPCPDCPEVPDDSQTLLDIKKAIYTIPAVLLVIYFFYIMFGWYLGGRS